MVRTTDTCPHRSDVRSSDDGEVGVCKLLKKISGVHDVEFLAVSRDACEACCESFEPTESDLNPIAASLLFGLTEQVIAVGGVDGCDAPRATELNRWAERSLPAVAPDEDDGIDLGRQVSVDYGHVTEAQIVSHLPRPDQGPKNQVRTWMVGMTTAPRRMPTVEQSIDSVIRAGWKDPVLFVDGEVDLPDSANALLRTVRTPALGAFPNYVLSLQEMYMRDPHADAYMLVQDDAVILSSSATRDYLESIMWPVEGPCIASLYCSAKYAREEAGWHQFEENWVWGAVAFVFSPEALRCFLTSNQVLDHRALPDDKGLSRIDVVVGNVARENGIPILYPCPSLVQHIGTISTIWRTGRAAGARRSKDFLGDLIEPV